MRIKIVNFIGCLLMLGASVTAQEKASSAIDLSPNGQKAFDLLLTADTFEDTYVGYDGELSKFVAAYRQVLNEPNKVAALKSLLEKASKPGQLYALAGLYDADYPYFKSIIDNYKSDHSEVDTRSGCLGLKKEVSEIVYYDKPNTVRFEHQYQSFDEWKRRARPTDGFFMDISGGGYSLMFRGHDLFR